MRYILAFLAAILMSVAGSGVQASGEKRVALVIGNGSAPWAGRGSTA